MGAMWPRESATSNGVPETQPDNNKHVGGEAENSPATAPEPPASQKAPAAEPSPAETVVGTQVEQEEEGMAGFETCSQPTDAPNSVPTATASNEAAVEEAATGGSIAGLDGGAGSADGKADCVCARQTDRHAIKQNRNTDGQID